MIRSGGWPKVRWRATRVRRRIDLVLPIEGIQQGGPDFLNC